MSERDEERESTKARLGADAERCLRALLIALDLDPTLPPADDEDEIICLTSDLVF
jgi:hypothetical protein